MAESSRFMILFVNVTFASGVPDGDFDSLALVVDS
jgi:hypothetical protein